MTLIKSISGIRGTIGGKQGKSLSPIDIVKFVSGFSIWLKNQENKSNCICVGRDARISGEMINQIVCSTLNFLGLNVIDLGLATTPTVEMAVIKQGAMGGIIITASHNPENWNALKLLNSSGEFISAEDGNEVLKIAENNSIDFSTVENLGTYLKDDRFLNYHINQILNLPLIKTQKIKNRKFKIVVDAVNSVGGIAVPKLLDEFGVDVIELYCEPNGRFPHNPEPLKENLKDVSKKVVEEKADLGIVVDPDVDRLAIVCEDGTMFGEEYTLVAVADYVLSHIKGPTVSNLSSSLALRDISEKHSCLHFSSAVGEVNVVKLMKEKNAIIGGEGNGGIIFPELHYGRDALVGIALFLSYLSVANKKCSLLKQVFPQYYMAKEKVAIHKDINFGKLLKLLKDLYKENDCNTLDGLKVTFDKSWVHIRKSNTEPIVRIYAEATTQEKANVLAQDFVAKIQQISN